MTRLARYALALLCGIALGGLGIASLWASEHPGSPVWLLLVIGCTFVAGLVALVPLVDRQSERGQ